MFDRLVDDCFLMLTLEGGQLTVDLSGVHQSWVKTTVMRRWRGDGRWGEDPQSTVVTNYQQIWGLRHPLYLVFVLSWIIIKISR